MSTEVFHTSSHATFCLSEGQVVKERTMERWDGAVYILMAWPPDGKLLPKLGLAVEL